MKRLFAGTLTAMLALSLTACGQQEQGDAKPVIYLYPEQETTVSVSLDYAGTLTATYPAYDNGWTVTAEPDGTLYDENGDAPAVLIRRIGRGERARIIQRHGNRRFLLRIEVIRIYLKSQFF